MNNVGTLQALENLSQTIVFDELPHLQGKVSDLDWNFIKNLFHSVDKKVTMHNAQSMGIIKQQGTQEYPTYGGMILFGINRLNLFPEAIIRCARFLGIDKDVLLDRADIEIYLPLALEEAMKFIQRNTSLRSEIKGLARKDIPQYPLIALREAIVNAIVHADYAMKGVYISIAIFDDRIEITNPGGLPFGFTIEKALAGASRIRNRVIAKVFYHMKWVEQWGSGIRRIIKECAQRDLEEPKFEELNNQFRVTLYANKKKKITLGPWHKELVQYLKKKGKISTKDAADLWHVTPRTARNRLIKIVDAGIIKKVGLHLRDPQSNYVLTDKKI